MEDSPVISKEQFNTMSIWFLIPANVLITVIGISTNTLNIITFSKMTPKDSMTMSFLALAVSDFLFSLLNCGYYVISGLIFNGYPVLFSVDLESLLVTVFMFERPLFHKISALITTFASCERALCVIKPFLVKRIFTKRRCVIALVTIYASMTAFFVPVYASGRLEWQYPPNATEKILVARFTPTRYTAETVVILIPALSLVMITQVIILIMAILMTVGLRKHQKFRQTMSMQTDTTAQNKSKLATQGNQLKEISEKEEDNSKELANSGDAKVQQTLSKEDRLIKTVLILAVMHISLNTPLCIFYIVYPIEQEFRAYRYYHNIFMAATDFVNIFQSLNGVFNILVYLKMNAKYKSVFKQTFSK